MNSPVAFLLLLAALLASSGPVRATPPELLRTPGYQSPVHAAADDLLFMAGEGFQSGDRVIYEDVRARATGHPAQVPESPSAVSGTAEVVHRDADGRALVVRLPDELSSATTYRIWVVTEANEWSTPLLVNDPRPAWISPDFVYASASRPGLSRRIRIVGRNLGPSSQKPNSIRLRGPVAYELAVIPASDPAAQVGEYLAEANLPTTLAVGSYRVSIRRAGERWIDLPEQTLEVRPNPRAVPELMLTDQRFGGCHVGMANHSACLLAALGAARAAGGGVIVIPAGNWNLAADSAAGYEIPPGVSLRGQGPDTTSIKWLPRKRSDSRNPLLTLTSRNVIEGISFIEGETFSSPAQVRPVIRLGTPADSSNVPVIDDIVISNDRFVHVGMAIVDSGRSLRHLVIDHSQFGAYQNALYLAHVPDMADSIVRWNHFQPGSYVDIGAHQGTIASEIGASRRVDFSDNFVDGASTGALQSADDQHGFRAAFFWNLTGNHEQLLIARNRIECPGDKAGDGEAIAFDDNGNSLGFEAAQPVEAAGSDWVRVHATLSDPRLGHRTEPDQFVGHWVLLTEGRGLGQTRKITAVIPDRNGTGTTLRIQPAWDVQPGTHSRLVVSLQFWQAYIVANEVRQDSPTCRKSNLNGPNGGAIGIWASSSDSVIDGNHQVDSGGIGFNQSYSAQARSCPSCRSSIAFQTALEIARNVIDGEYEWSSDCSKSGISGTFAASPTPESPPPRLSFGVSVAHNEISHADGFRGGAIDIALGWYSGPPPGDWPMVDNLLVFHNDIHDVEGSPPRSQCRFGQKARSALRIEGKRNTAILYGNRCERAGSCDATK